MAKTFSGAHVVKILIRHFEFVLVSQKGSHIKLVRVARGGHRIVTIVPNHKEVQVGTLNGILKQAEVEKKDFMTVAK